MTVDRQRVFVEVTVNEMMRDSRLLIEVIKEYQRRLLEDKTNLLLKLEERPWHGEDTR